MEEMPKVGEPMEVGIAACDFDAKMEEEEELEDEVREEWEEEEEEEDEPLSEEELARRRRRDMFPTETLDEICRFMAFSECARTYTTNRLFQALLEPRRKVCMEVVRRTWDWDWIIWISINPFAVHQTAGRHAATTGQNNSGGGEERDFIPIPFGWP